MRWPQYVRLTLAADDQIAADKEQADRAARERALAANGMGR